MANKYAFEDMKENMARAMMKDLDISTKVAIEVANFIRGRSVENAKMVLNRVLEYKQAVPYKRFPNGVGHRSGKGMAAGRYPQKASQYFIDLIEQAEANAQTKGLSSDLKIVHLAAQGAAKQWHYGRQRRREMKRTHIEIVVEEQEKKKEAKKESKSKGSKETTKPKEQKKTEEKQ